MNRSPENEQEKMTATDYIFYGAFLFIVVVVLLLILQVWF